jgi:hypothetical protein
MSDKNLMRALRAVEEREIERAPKQHRLRTPECPSLSRLAAGFRDGFTKQERRHVEKCAYCQRMRELDRRDEKLNSEGPSVPETRTALLVQAISESAARRELVEMYQHAVFAFYCGIVQGPNRSEATRDLTQDFLLHFFLEPELRFARYLELPPPRPRFRSYVWTAARHLFEDQLDMGRALKRGGNLSGFSLDANLEKYEPLLAKYPRLSPEERADLTADLDRLWRASQAVIQELSAPHNRPPLEQALFAHLDADNPPLPLFAELAARHRTTVEKVRQRWNRLRADQELIRYLAEEHPPYAELARRFEMEPGTLATRFSRLRDQVERHLAEILATEFDVPDPRRAAEEVARLLNALKHLRDNQQET